MIGLNALMMPAMFNCTEAVLTPMNGNTTGVSSITYQILGHNIRRSSRIAERTTMGGYLPRIVAVLNFVVPFVIVFSASQKNSRNRTVLASVNFVKLDLTANLFSVYWCVLWTWRSVESSDCMQVMRWESSETLLSCISCSLEKSCPYCDNLLSCSRSMGRT